MVRLLLAGIAITLLAAMPSARAAGVEQLEANKKTVAAFEDAALNQKDFNAASKYLGATRSTIRTLPTGRRASRATLRS